MSRLKVAAFAVAVAGLACITAADAQVQRTFVASYGSDANTANNCNFANPCRSFTAALAKTIAGGEVVALDAAGYGAVTIDKIVTITANPGFYAGISAASGSAITITSPGPVTLRGLNINGIGGDVGVDVTVPSAVVIEHCVIGNFVLNAVKSLTAGTVRISDSTITGNGDAIYIQGNTRLDIYRSKLNGNSSGVIVDGSIASTTAVGTVTDSEASSNSIGLAAIVSGSGAGTAKLAISRTTVSNNGNGIMTVQDSGMALVTAGYNTVTGNGTGFQNVSGTIESLGNNIVRQNNTHDTNGTITTIGGT